ncbi:MAG TPA: TonB-dependent receptor [Wenzhouxiangellaceae bacterium]|nr:TonB-dependent receptor [Wenzhouxiangellaceae bacterium]
MRKLAITLLFYGFSQVAIVAWAQTDGDPEQVDSVSSAASEPEIDDTIVVTAQRREEALSTVPLAITAVSGDALSRLGATDTTALGQLAPNVNFANETSRDAVFITIRGISATDNRNEADPTTAFHIDGGYVPRLSGANAYFFDVERVEILRGPQGTLYGRNSTSGAVNLISRKPENDFGGFVETRYGNFDRFLTTGAINVPLVDDTLAVRLAFINESRDGFRDNTPVREKGDDAEDFAARLHVLGRPTERLTILGTVETYQKSGVGGVQAFLPFEGNPNPSVVAPSRTRFPLNTEGFRDNNTDASRLNVNYDLDFATATYQFSYRDEERESLNDLDGTAVSDSILQETFSSESTTHELRLASNGDRNLDWIVGAFYLDEELNSVFNIQIPTSFGAFSRLDFDFVDRNQSSRSYAFFAQGTYALNESLDLTVGGRYTKDEKKKPDSQQVIRRLDAMGPPPFQIISQNQSADFEEATWRIALDYTLPDKTLIYGSVSTGYKAGGFNRGASQQVYDPETVISYETGIKTALFDNLLRLNAAAFLYDYEDLQLAQVETQPNGVIENITRNAASADIWGLELEASARPWNGGNVALSLGYLNTEFQRFPNVLDDLTGNVEDLSGNRLVNAPEFTATLTLEPITIPVGSGTLTPLVQFHYESDAFLRVQNRESDRRDDFSKTDVRLRYSGADDAWFVEGFVQNIEDNNVLYSVSTGTFIIGSGPSFKGVFGAPRTYGIRIGAQF